MPSSPPPRRAPAKRTGGKPAAPRRAGTSGRGAPATGGSRGSGATRDGRTRGGGPPRSDAPRAGGPPRGRKPVRKTPAARPGPNRRADTGREQPDRPARTGAARGDARRSTTGLRPRDGAPPEAWEPELWIDEGPVRAAAETAVARGHEADKRQSRRRLPADVVDELDTLGGPKRAARLEERLDAARRAFERDRWLEAARILSKLAREAPGAPSVRELHGLTLYRLERWRAAAGELEAYRSLTGAVDQNPVLADCYRALKRYRSIEPLWEELKEVSPTAELVTEGRIVVAGALADQGRVAEAIALLARAASTPRRVRQHHLRQWYALADLYDRSGDLPRARALFTRIEAAAPGFADTPDRLRTVGR